MEYQVIRKRASNLIVAFGPNNGNFAHPVNDDEVLCYEPFEVMYAEWKLQPRPKTRRDVALEALQAAIDGTGTVKEALSSLKWLL